MRHQNHAGVSCMADRAESKIISKEGRKPAPNGQWRAKRPPRSGHKGLQAAVEEEAVRKQERQHQQRPRSACGDRAFNHAFDIDENRPDISLRNSLAHLLHNAGKSGVAAGAPALATPRLTGSIAVSGTGYGLRSLARNARGEGRMSTPHGRPKGRQSLHGAAQRRTQVTPFLGEGVGGRVLR